MGRRLAEVTKELAGCKLNGSAIVYDSDEDTNEGLVVGEAVFDQADPPPAVRMPNYDAASGEDDAGAIQNARDVKLPFNKNDILLWFTLIESKMQFAGLKKQWSKRQVLIQLIPPEFHNDLKQYLILQEDDAGDLPYKTLKDAIVKLL